MFKKSVFLILLLTVSIVNAAVENGYINLSYIDINEKSVVLSGNWQFFPYKTYSEAKAEGFTNPTTIKVPGSWNDILQKKDGYGLYRILIKVDDYKKYNALGFKINSISNAANIFIDGNLIAKSGVFSTNKNLAVPDYSVKLIGFKPQSDTIEIAIEVCNFEYRIGGIMFAPNLGGLEFIRNNRNFNLILFAALMGALLIVFIYFLGFYFVKKTYKVAIVFSLMCLFSALRIGSTGDLILKTIFNGLLNYHFLIRIEFISLFMIIGFGLLFIQKMLPYQSKTKIPLYVLYVNVTLSVFTLFAPVSISSQIIPPYLIFILVSVSFGLYLILQGLLTRSKPFYVNAFGFFVLFAFGINDIFVSQYMVDRTIYTLPIGIFVFVILQAFSITKMFAIAFNEVDTLSIELKNINTNLETSINDRTKEINKQKDELAESNKVKDKIFSIIAHDMRAPLKSLQSVLDFVNDDDITLNEIKLYLNGIRKNVSSLNLMLENVLNWSKLQMGGINRVPELFDARLTIQNVLNFYEMMAKEKNITLINQVNERASVYTDKEQLNIIFRNLINNAIKFSNEGSSIYIKSAYTDNNKIKFSVVDEGVGISKDRLDKIFNIESSFSTFGTKNEKGTGLGLQLCKEYIELNGGEIFIESEPNSGTTISFTVPINQQ
ncbi:MAG: ATP-binding protein [Bacteroidia bacterium]